MLKKENHNFSRGGIKGGEKIGDRVWGLGVRE